MSGGGVERAWSASRAGTARPAAPAVLIRQTAPGDFAAIIKLSRRVYSESPPWREEQLASHLERFPEGQLVAVSRADGRLLGMAASLVVWWNDYAITGTWREFTAGGYFTNHDPVRGRTLYGAEIMVSPSARRQGVGSALYVARRELARHKGLLRIRAGARLRGYARHADRLSALDYAIEVAHGRLHDPTLSFQLKQGFGVLAVVPGYLGHDPESLGFAAVIEWLNPDVAKPEDAAGRDPRFPPPGPLARRSC